MPTRWAVTRALRTSGLPAPARLIVHELATRADNDTAVIPDEFGVSLSELAEATGLGRSTVARALNLLELSGWVKRSRPTVEAARSEGARTAYALKIGGSPAAGLVPERDHGGSPAAGPAVVPERDGPSPAAGRKKEPFKSTTKDTPRRSASSTRGTRIPDDFAATAEMIAWAREHTPKVGAKETDAFVDYWRGAAGAKGVKLDWLATWRNWMRREQQRWDERQDRSRPPTVPTVEDERCPTHPHELAGYCRRCPTERG